MINCILLVLLLPLSMVLLKCTSFYLVIYFLKFVQLFHLWMHYDLVRFFCDLLSLVVPDDYSCKDIHFFVSQNRNSNLSGKVLVSYHVTSLFTNIPPQETIVVAINLILNHNPNLKITKKEL